MYDISEDSTYNSTDFQQGMQNMTNSYWFEIDSSSSGSSGTFRTKKGSTTLTSSISFTVNDIFKYQRTGTSMKLFVAGVEKQEWTGTSESLRFCIYGFHQNGDNSIDQVQFQN